MKIVKRALLALLVLFLFLATFPGFSGGYFSDDVVTLDAASRYKSWESVLKPDVFGYMRPVKNAVFWVFSQLVPIEAGKTPAGAWKPHTFTFLCYLAGLFMVLRFSKDLFQKFGGVTASGEETHYGEESKIWVFPLLIVFFWGFSATNASTALWLSCFNLPLCAGSIALAVRAQLRQEDRWRPSAWVIVWSALAMIFYETGVAVVPLLFFVEWLKGFDWKNKKLWVRLVYPVLVLGGFLALRHFTGAKNVAGNDSWAYGTTPLQAILSAPWGMLTHFKMWVFPWGNLQILGSYQWGVTASVPELVSGWIFLLSWSGFIWFLRKRAPLAAFGAGWFLIVLLPSSNLIPVFATAFAEYYVVIPGIGLAIMAADLIFKGLSASSRSVNASGWILRALIVLFVGSRLFVAAEYAKVASIFSVPGNYLEHTRSNYKTSWNIDISLSRFYLTLGDLRKCAFYAEKSLAANQVSWESHKLLADAAAYQNDHKLAIRNMETCLATPYRYKEAEDLGYPVYFLLVYYCKKDGEFYNPERALELCKTGRHYFPSTWHGFIVEMYVRLLADAGKKDEALELMEKGLKFYPNSSYMNEVQQQLVAGTYVPSGGYTTLPPLLQVP